MVRNSASRIATVHDMHLGWDLLYFRSRNLRGVRARTFEADPTGRVMLPAASGPLERHGGLLSSFSSRPPVMGHTCPAPRECSLGI